jgi:hypothetical protein
LVQSRNFGLEIEGQTRKLNQTERRKDEYKNTPKKNERHQSHRLGRIGNEWSLVVWIEEKNKKILKKKNHQNIRH